MQVTIFTETPLCSNRSTFAVNFKYLSYKYNISQDEWFTDLSHLIEKVDIKFHKDFQNPSAKFNTTGQDVVIQNSALTCVTTTKFLGVIIDHKTFIKKVKIQSPLAFYTKLEDS